MSAFREETLALIEEMEASLATTPPEMQQIVRDQIKNLRDSIRMLDGVTPQIEEAKRHRPVLSDAVRAFFTPAPGPEIPTWVADTTVRQQASASIMRCPTGAQVYEDEESLVCAVPQGLGTIPTRQGLSLGFYPSGRLRSQAMYEQGLLRWSVSYHATGDRESYGFFADRVEREHLYHGLWTALSSNGIVTAQTYWHGGIRHGWVKLWEEDGYPIGATLYDQGREVDHLLADGTRPARQG